MDIIYGGTSQRIFGLSSRFICCDSLRSEIKASHFTALESAAGIKLQCETIWWLPNFTHAGLIFDDRPIRNVHPTSDPLFSLPRDYPHGIIAKCYIQSHINHSLLLGSWEPPQGTSPSAPWWWAGELLPGNTSFRRFGIPTLGSLGIAQVLIPKRATHIMHRHRNLEFSSGSFPLITPLLFPPVAFLFQWCWSL